MVHVVHLRKTENLSFDFMKRDDNMCLLRWVGRVAML